MKKNLLIITWSIMMQHNVVGQAKTGIENYHFLSSEHAYTWMPVIHHEGKKGFYTEMRYNYEALKTGSLYAGKNFTGSGKIDCSFTPMAGIVFGKFNGGSLAMNMELGYKGMNMSMQTQYSVSRESASDDFFFNWSELTYEPLPWFYTGISAQFLQIHNNRLVPEYGILAGFMIKKLTIPVYVFNPLNSKRNFIIGINTAW